MKANKGAFRPKLSPNAHRQSELIHLAVIPMAKIFQRGARSWFPPRAGAARTVGFLRQTGFPRTDQITSGLTTMQKPAAAS